MLGNMLKHTQKIKETYEDIERKIFYMIPEKWEKMYLYASIIDEENTETKGEMFFYYIPKGILKKNPVNVYQIPAKFNLDEKEYLSLVELLYQKIKELREEFKKIELGMTWSNVTFSIEGVKFKAEYRYDDLVHSEFSNYDRHIIWRYRYLGIRPEQVNKEEREMLKRYLTGAKTFVREEVYQSGIYIKDIKNMVDFDTTKIETAQENNAPKHIPQEQQNQSQSNQKREERPRKNQILTFLDEIEKEEKKKQ